MQFQISQNAAILFPLFFAFMWLSITTILGFLSGWFRLMTTYPDRISEPLLQLRGQSGMMGLGVNMSGILTFSVCPIGLRVRMTRLFGPFCRTFLVPWDAIAVDRTTIFLWPVARLEFGRPVVGKLRIAAHVADKLARTANGQWPEMGPFPEETHRTTFRRLLQQWAIVTCAAALFFTLAPLAMGAEGGPPVAVAILFPAVMFGVVFLWRYFRERA